MATPSIPLSTTSSEFNVEDAPKFNRRTPIRWVISHLLHLKWWVALFLVTAFLTELFNAMIPGYTGQAFDIVIGDDLDRLGQLQQIAIILIAIVLVRGIVDFIARVGIEVLAASLQRNSREEMFISLLGKSQTFHNRQKVGDIMARAINDIRQMNYMISPGADLILSSMIALIVPLWFMGQIDLKLLYVPFVFIVLFFIALVDYMKRLSPVSDHMRASFGAVNANLNESVHGIEVIKSTGQELPELGKFSSNARKYRDWSVKQGLVQAWYVPTLIFSVSMAIGIIYGIYLQQQGQITVGELVAYSVLWQQFGFPVHISTFSFSMVQIGLAGARRVLELINEKTELDQNTGGFVGDLRGEIEFQDVTFSYEDGADPVLSNVSFRAEPGETIAIVGETGSGKSTLSKLVNRIFDVDSGRILIDGRDVREWNLDSLRSQISVIEQDVTLFSRSIAENIAFSSGQGASREDVVQAARDAQAHEFIVETQDGYDTVIGERGLTLSGGQRQRLAIARALLNKPRMLMLDDSTSAIDSATEDDIQRAMQRLLEGRTSFVITHRLSQIRWSDKVLLLRRGTVSAFGTHDELLEESPLYKRIFSHYDEVEV